MSQLDKLSDDLYRIVGKRGFFQGVWAFITGQSFKYIAVFRLCKMCRETPLLILFYPFLRFYLIRLEYKLGISIPVVTDIDGGLMITHFGGVVISRNAIIGKNCNISQGVTIGKSNRGKLKGCPVIGCNVYIGPNAVISGAIKIGDGAVIGPGCIINFDVDNNAVMACSRPAVISYAGSEGYVNRRVA